MAALHGSPKPQTVHRAQAKPGASRLSHRNLVRFPQAQGKLLEGVEFSTTSGYHNITLIFQDKTCLNFVVDVGFTLSTDYSDWKTGNQQLLHQWPPIRNYDWRTDRARNSGKRRKNRG